MALGTGCASDPVDVVAGEGGKVEVDDEVDRRDIEAARGNVGGEQYGGALRAEGIEGRQSLRLRLPAVQGDGRELQLGQ
eukprot:CAMPEP_0117670364 /NCGR_PEP_ID=MMETSP0804-20121206/12703_1 /TAXON_ID=1074897 /ORGANISM="Tetraselmis astigmatica, Strain CCMP880" /LENGTH=78 /DNA_ID=CAMNT_0005478637 /DNA_START=398 /DNA_END=634 /DNA_ORIENTATION=+